MEYKHKEIIMDKSKSSPFRIFDVNLAKCWDYFLSEETLYFESNHDMHNFLLVLHRACFCCYNIDNTDILICETSSAPHATRVKVFSNRLWYLVEVRNCTSVVLKKSAYRSDINTKN